MKTSSRQCCGAEAGAEIKFCVVFIRVVDPYSFFTDPDPDPELDVGGQYGSGSGSRALMTKN